jgi:hypothetical protein
LKRNVDARRKLKAQAATMVIIGVAQIPALKTVVEMAQVVVKA